MALAPSGPSPPIFDSQDQKFTARVRSNHLRSYGYNSENQIVTAAGTRADGTLVNMRAAPVIDPVNQSQQSAKCVPAFGDRYDAPLPRPFAFENDSQDHFLSQG